MAVGDYRTFAKVSPPLRAEHDRKAVVEGLADDTIDAVASDHTPSDQDSKRLPFAQAEAGILFCPPQNVIDEFPQFPVANDYDALRAEFATASEREI